MYINQNLISYYFSHVFSLKLMLILKTVIIYNVDLQMYI